MDVETGSRPEWLEERDYPFESRFLEVDGGRLHYVDEGEGHPILMVHGQPTWSYLYRHLIRGLSPRFRCIAVDHIGFGLSDKPRDWSYTPAAHAANLARLVDHLDLAPLTLVVHDWGGPIGLGAALADTGRYRRFALLNTAAFRSRHMPWRIRLCRLPLLGRLAVQGFNGFARAALRMAVCHRERMTNAVRAGILAPYESA